MSKIAISVRGLGICALICLVVTSAPANTIIKLNLGGVGPDIGMNGNGQLATVNDGIAGTTGDQNTNIEYTDFLDFIRQREKR